MTPPTSRTFRMNANLVKVFRKMQEDEKKYKKELGNNKK
jgi:hypothetical protein